MGRGTASGFRIPASVTHWFTDLPETQFLHLYFNHIVWERNELLYFEYL